MLTDNEKQLLQLHLINDWSKYSKIRQRPLWQAILMSFGIAPNAAAVKAVKASPGIASRYQEMKNELSLLLSQEELEGYIQFIPHLQKSKNVIAKSSFIIDMVSCIEVIKNHYPDFICSEFLSLKIKLSKLHLRRDVSPNRLLVLSTSSVTSDTKQKAIDDRIAKGNETKKNERYDILIYILANMHFKYKGSFSAKERGEIIDNMVIKMSDEGFGKFGLGVSAVTEILERAFETAKKSKLPLP